jgi:hypothetical protein
MLILVEMTECPSLLSRQSAQSKHADKLRIRQLVDESGQRECP